MLKINLSICFILSLAPILPAAHVTWVANSSGNWKEAANWSSQPNLPGSSDDVILDVAGPLIDVTHDTFPYFIRAIIGPTVGAYFWSPASSGVRAVNSLPHVGQRSFSSRYTVA
jgi:hypothetical protein